MDFIAVASQLLRPWAYYSIDAEGKRVFDWVVPVLIAATVSIAFFLGEPQISIFGDDGLVADLTTFIQGLPGFFIAALAAVATFNRDDLDTLLPAPTPTMLVVKRGKPVPLELTRRRFLCALFAFLTAQSLLLTCAGIFAANLSPWLIQALPFAWLVLFKVAGGFLFLLLLAQLLSVTCLGLYYLGDRLHLPD